MTKEAKCHFYLSYVGGRGGTERLSDLLTVARPASGRAGNSGCPAPEMRSWPRRLPSPRQPPPIAHHRHGRARLLLASLPGSHCGTQTPLFPGCWPGTAPPGRPSTRGRRGAAHGTPFPKTVPRCLLLRLSPRGSERRPRAEPGNLHSGPPPRSPARQAARRPDDPARVRPSASGSASRGLVSGQPQAGRRRRSVLSRAAPPLGVVAPPSVTGARAGSCHD